MSDLLPCPFCDSVAAYAFEEDVWHLVRCTNRKCGIQGGIFPTKPWAFRIWNTRVPAQQTSDARLRMAVEFGVWSMAGPTNDAEIAQVEKWAEAAWEEFRAATPIDQDPLESSAAVAQDAVNVLVAGSNPASPATPAFPSTERGGEE